MSKRTRKRSKIDRDVRITARRQRRSKSAPKIPSFYDSIEWKRLRYAVLRERGAKCEVCGATPADGATMNVDHVKPRHKYPDLALERSNLAVLCAWCNAGKGGREDDYRVKTDAEPANDDDLGSFERWHFGR